ncbi:hypothetical protein D3C77_516590 [compost metagenome]
MARYRGGRACGQYRQPADGRDPGKRRPRHRHRQLGATTRCVRRHHPVQLPGHDPAVDVPAGHRLRQQLHPQAVRTGPADAQSPGRTVPRSRRPPEHPAGVAWRARGGRCAAHPSAHPRTVLRRLGGGRPACLPHRHPAPEARASLRRRQESSGGATGCEPGTGAQQPDRCQLRRRRATLHGHQRGAVRWRVAPVDSRTGHPHG